MEFRSMSFEVTPSQDEMYVEGRVNDLGWSKLLGQRKRFVEKIERGTFTKAIERAMEQNRPIDLLGDHNYKYLLASTQNGSLALEEREDGLYMKAKISDTDYGRRFYTLLKDGLFCEMSFGFTVNEKGDQWVRQEDGTYKRYVHDIELYESSIVREGAYNNTKAQLMARGIDVVEDPEFSEEVILEQELREMGLTIEELINKAVQEATEKVSSQYHEVINDLNEKFESLKTEPKEEVKEEVVAQVEEPKPQEVQQAEPVKVEEIKVESVEEPKEEKVDIEAYKNEINLFKSMKEVIE